MIYSCLSYPGSKRKVVDKLMEVLPEGIKDWREPFFGSGSVTIAFLQNEKSRDCTRFLVGDLYKEVYCFWIGLQRNPALVEKYILDIQNRFFKHLAQAQDMLKSTEMNEELYETAVQEGRNFWEWSRDFNRVEKETAEERAARFFVVNKVSFSAMGDSGSLSKDRLMGYRPDRFKPAYELSNLLQRVEILNAPFQETMKNATKENRSFVFLDPPYIAQEGSGLYGRNGDTHHGFPHLELAELCKSLTCNWLMTIDDSIEARKLYAGCNIEEFYIQYTMAMVAAEDALAGEELLVSNYKLHEEEDFSLLDSIL